MYKLEVVKDEAKHQTIKCEVCDKPLLTDDDNCHFAEINRGYYKEDDDGDVVCERTKARFFICHDCYLNDLDLCRFFNKLGWRIR